jgi:hypothetical protein
MIPTHLVGDASAKLLTRDEAFLIAVNICGCLKPLSHLSEAEMLPVGCRT